MTNNVAVANPLTPVSASTMEQVVIGGDLGRLTSHDRVSYYRRVCESIGLNPFTKPFQYIHLNDKLTLYATKDCTEQLRQIHGISITGLTPSYDQAAGIYTVVAMAKANDGRTDSATGAVPLSENMRGEARANAVMKAETKAKRRVTLSISGLGLLDESETSLIPDAQVVEMNDDLEALPEPTSTSQKNGAEPPTASAPAAPRSPTQGAGAPESVVQKWTKKLADETNPEVATMGIPELRKMKAELRMTNEQVARVLKVQPGQVQSSLTNAIQESSLVTEGKTYRDVAVLLLESLG